MFTYPMIESARWVMTPNLRMGSLRIALAACLLSAPAAGAEVRIVGHLDGIAQDGDHFFISGWACQ